MKKNLIIIAMLVALAVVPLMINQGAEFSGADGQAENFIAEIAPNYKPWIKPLFEPASGEIESLLFTLQGSLGCAVIFYILGFYQGRRNRNADH
jgi:cobalt/nickel transport protein